MATVLNEVTPYLRSLMRMWLSSVKREQFTLYDAVEYLESNHQLGPINLKKAVSNELIRLKGMGKIRSAGNQPMPVGRPVTLYEKSYCQDTLCILMDHRTSRKVAVEAGRVKLFVFGQGMTYVFKGIRVSNETNALELLDHHHEKIFKNSVDMVLE